MATLMAETAWSAGFSRHRGPQARDVVPLFAVMDQKSNAIARGSAVQSAALRAAGAG